MPSKRQPSGRGGTDYPTDAHRMLDEKDDATIRALIRGIRRPERARQYVKAELELADADDREPRRDLIGMVNSKVSELTEED